jgi:hypothetical protein
MGMECIRDMKSAYKISVGKREGKRSLGRPKDSLILKHIVNK